MEALLHSIVRHLPQPVGRHFDAARIRLATELVRFATVGLAGLAVDTACVYGLRWQLGLYGAGVVAYGVAATATWALNRAWTFRGRGSGSLHRQWGLFLAVNLVGFALNRGTYAALVTWSELCAANPVLATSAGAIAGMGVNFTLSRRVVFR